MIFWDGLQLPATLHLLTMLLSDSLLQLPLPHLLSVVREQPLPTKNLVETLLAQTLQYSAAGAPEIFQRTLPATRLNLLLGLQPFALCIQYNPKDFHLFAQSMVVLNGLQICHKYFSYCKIRHYVFFTSRYRASQLNLFHYGNCHLMIFGSD